MNNLSAETADTKAAIPGGMRAIPAGSNPAALTTYQNKPQLDVASVFVGVSTQKPTNCGSTENQGVQVKSRRHSIGDCRYHRAHGCRRASANLSAVEVEYQRGSVRGPRREHVANRCPVSPWPTLNTLCRHYAALTNFQAVLWTTSGGGHETPASSDAYRSLCLGFNGCGRWDRIRPVTPQTLLVVGQTSGAAANLPKVSDKAEESDAVTGMSACRKTRRDKQMLGEGNPMLQCRNAVYALNSI